MYQKFELSKSIEGTQETVVMPDDTRIHTISSGSGKTTILLAHGYGFSNMEWNIIVERLNELNYRSIVFDQRGHGSDLLTEWATHKSVMQQILEEEVTGFNALYKKAALPAVLLPKLEGIVE